MPRRGRGDVAALPRVNALPHSERFIPDPSPTNRAVEGVPTVPAARSTRTVRSGRTTPRGTSVRRGCGARPRRGRVRSRRTTGPPSSESQRLNVASRPMGASPIPTTSMRPGARCNSRSTTRPARPNVRHAPSRTSARVTTAIGPWGSPVSKPSSGSTPRQRPWPPRLRSRTCHTSSSCCQRCPIALAARKSIERRVAVPHREQRRAPRIDARPRVVGASGAEQPPEHQAGRAIEPEPIGAEPAHRQRGAPRGFAHEVERRDPAHGPSCCHAMDVSTPTGLLVTAVVGYLLGSIPVADLMTHRRSAVDLRDVGDHNPGYWNAKATLGRRAALPIFVGDVAKGDRRGARRRGARVPRRMGHGIRRGGGGDGRARLAAVRPLPWRTQRADVRRRRDRVRPGTRIGGDRCAAGRVRGHAIVRPRPRRSASLSCRSPSS